MSLTTPLPVVADSYPRQAARTRRFRLGSPRRITVSPDGERIVFIRSGAGDDPVGVLRAVDLAGRETVVADPAGIAGAREGLSAEEAARRERIREVTAGITDYSANDDVTRVAFALGGQVYVVALADTGPRRLDTAGSAIDPRMSPDGSHVAYVAEGSLRVVRWDGSADRALVAASSGTVTHGLADFIAAEELGRARGFWWSPDSTRLLVERVDTAAVGVWWIADPVHPDRQPVPHRYPAAGTPNAELTLVLVDLDGATQDIHWDSEEFCYLGDVSWTRYGDPLVVVLDRAQRRRHVFALDVDAGSLRTVAEHVDPHWLTSTPGQVRWAPDGRLLAVRSDGETYRLYGDDVALTPTGLQVDSLVEVTEDSAVFTAQIEPTSTRPYSVTWAGDVRAAGEPEGLHGIVVGGPTTVIATTSWAESGTTTTVYRGDGTSFALTSVAESPLVTPGVRPGHHLHRFGVNTLATAVLFPTDHVFGARRLPVIMAPYGGPGHSEVVAAGGAYGEAQWLADQGFVVIVADGRGTPGRGPAWERAIVDDMASVVLADQVDALTGAAAQYPDDIDVTRVGIRGWSFGGYLAALAVLRRPDVFHAAVAGAPVTEWRWYDTAYTERYLGHPDEAPDAYDRASLLPLAPGLSRPLLIVHGMTDDNVVVAHSLALSGALTAHGRSHSVLPLSGITHMATQEDVAENLLLLEVDFFRRSLRSPE